MRPPTCGGFTLIELLVTVAVLAILAAIAYPSYLDHVRKGRRTEALAVVLDIQLKEEKYRANNTRYGSRTEVGGVESNAYYTFDVPSHGANTYTVTATARPGTDQAQDRQGGVSCASLSLDQGGAKTPAACWR